MIEKYILLSEKSWHDDLFVSLSKNKNQKWFRIEKKEDFTLNILNKINPDKVFIPHWSHIITEEIYLNFECIVFHMTDLPYGRGGSPLQNLIINGKRETYISAIKVEKGIDAGDVYFKKKLSLKGSAFQIFTRASKIIHKMILELILNNIKPIPQIGNIVAFKRRTSKESDISKINDIEKVFDYIRMLDCDGYPHAFIENKKIRFEFTDAKYVNNKIIKANVKIFPK